MSGYRLIDDDLCSTLNHAARDTPRKRTHHNFHSELTDPVQRLCIALQPGTYVRPHRHPEEHKWEMMLVVSGSVHMLIFDDDGRLADRIELSAQGETRGIEIPPNTWHSLFPVNGEAVILEIKQGPYSPLAAENFASWAPEEDTPGVHDFLDWGRQADIGRYFGH